MPIEESLVQDVLVKFACTISQTRGSRAAEREALDGIAEAWPDFFIDPTGLSVRASGPAGPLQQILLRGHKYYVKTQIATLPSLLLFPEALEIHLYLKMNGVEVPEFHAFPWADDEAVLAKVKNVIMKLQAAYRFNVHRTAKTYEMKIFLPEIEQRLALNTRVFGERGENTAELQFVKTDAINADDLLYNVRTQVRYNLLETAEGNSLVLVNFDVNNREMSNSLNERTWMKIWKHGEKLRDQMIEAVFPGGA